MMLITYVECFVTASMLRRGNYASTIIVPTFKNRSKIARED